tara:strand:- start:210 stop:383 length:174 start_codon:yes stop_codon:yes gene_type:complete
MTKYRILSKSILADNLDEDEVYVILEQLRYANPELIYEIEKCDPPEQNRLGRDPDLH